MDDSERKYFSEIITNKISQMRSLNKNGYTISSKKFDVSRISGEDWYDLILSNNNNRELRISFYFDNGGGMSLVIYRPKDKAYISGSYNSLSLNDYIRKNKLDYSHCLKWEGSKETLERKIESSLSCLENLFLKDKKIADVLLGEDWVNIEPVWYQYK